MKSYLSLFLVCMLMIATGCTKEKLPAGYGPSSVSVVGNWELRERSGGWSGQQFQPGNGNRYELTDRKYKQFINGKLVNEGRYRIQKDSFLIHNQLADMIVFLDQPGTLGIKVTVNGNNMEFAFDAYDAGSEVYERQ